MREFIEAFKKTSYYQYLFEAPEILGIFILGSRSTGLADQASDYDIVILTLDGQYVDVSRYEYLTYKGKKVHWYYNSIINLLNPGDRLSILCHIQLRNLCEDLIIYENPKYARILNKLYQLKDRLSLLGIYRFFENEKSYINEILAEGKILEEHYTKYIYHLCLMSYYLTGEELDKDFLKTLKRIMTHPVSDEYKSLAIERLKIYQNYIETHPINLKKSFNDLYEEIALDE